MAVFKVLLIILVAAPVIGFALYYYFELLDFIRTKNRKEDAVIKEMTERMPDVRDMAVPERAPAVEAEEKPERKKRSGRKAGSKKTDGKAEKKTGKKPEKKAGKSTEKKKKR